MNTTVALAFGLFGYQRTEEVGVFDAVLNLTTIHWVQASFLLSLLIFRKSKIDVTTISIASVLIIVNFARLLFGGSRGSLLPIFSAAIIAYALSGRRFSVKQVLLASVAFAVILIAGMVYGTNFRHVKGGESQQDLGQYTENIFQTIDEVGRSDISGTIGSGFVSLAERLDIVSTLAVVVSIREQKQPFEEAYGLDDNIFKDLIASLIPRFLWNDKPSLSDPRAYSELYFDYGESSFAITPMGDLLRNYGYFGVFLGMFVLGFALRYIYASLIEGQPRSVWRMTMYFMLLTSVTYESFYGPIIPFFLKTGAIAAIGIVIVAFLASRIDVGKRRKDPRTAF
jgi:hypothetical protein